jgi:Gas vesicle synthesis protein GvpO
MAELTDAQRKRAEARKQRRSQADGDQPEPESIDDSSPREGVRHAAKVAAAGAAVGAAAAAARALTSHHDEDQGDEAEDLQHEEAPPEPDEHDADEGPERRDAAPAPETERRPEPEPVQGAGPSDARAVADRAREQLEELLERRVEAISSLERTHDGWVAGLEVVELSRIPESTDVLGSYEMELDEDLNLRRYRQVRRYHRGRADLGEDS